MTSVHKKIVLANGVFDILHYGHLRHLYAARRLGDWLVVAVTKDAFVNKGPGRPVFPEYERLEMVDALYVVDKAILVESAEEALVRVRPDIFVKGSDYKGKIAPEHEAYCKANNIEIVFTEEPHYSSTKLLHYYDRLGHS